MQKESTNLLENDPGEMNAVLPKLDDAASKLQCSDEYHVCWCIWS